ncbi:hydrogen peroxide-inducible genes activator [Oceaniglobus ichthyenteri]|uniref:hydrogen peroxide-inducible genes activator n=1 Tax=Oceaniglobus ichthyenteri TaxID=2136177 RepID=UPI000D373578|nr:hydrogen peroxide-inducible genes activator [Oceaniglobus ichthyenteri]
MTNLTLKQLRYFEALAAHGHFGRAADACAISQPALSVQIKELEQGLGVALFERGPRHARLTAFGEDFARRARRILAQVDELGDLARAAQGALSGRLRLGVIPTIAPYLLPGLVARLDQTHPAVELHVRETTTPRLIEELGGGRLDAAILALPIEATGLRDMVLFRENLLLVRHRDAADEPVPSRDALAQMRLLLLEEGHCFRDEALSFCNMGSGLSGEGLDGSSLSTLVQLVGAGIGVTLIPQMAVGVETRAAPVCVGRFADPQPMRTVGLVWRQNSPLSDQFENLGLAIRQVAQDMGLSDAHT